MVGATNIQAAESSYSSASSSTLPLAKAQKPLSTTSSDPPTSDTPQPTHTPSNMAAMSNYTTTWGNPVALNATGPDFSNATAFNLYRPSFHFQPPTGAWINDPCAPFYEPSTDTYHLYFQYVPESTLWATSIGWGHAQSTNGMVDWQTVDRTKVLTPNVTRLDIEAADEVYDKQGVFTGSMMTLPKGTLKQLTGNDTDAGYSDDYIIVYTSVTVQPNAPGYVENSEGVALAYPINGSFARLEKYAKNPIITGSPVQNVSGYRDPFVMEWPAMDKTLNKTNGLYGILAGGYWGVEPTFFFYEIDRNDITKWSYLGDLVRGLGAQYVRSKWSPSTGGNWEVVNQLELTTTLSTGQNVTRDFLAFGAEKCTESAYRNSSGMDSGVRRPCRHLVYISGSLNTTTPTSEELQGNVTTQQVPRMNASVIGAVDWGNYYAQNGFKDPNTQTHTVYAWTTEDDVSANVSAAQGWSGAILLPRNLTLKAIEGVESAIKTELSGLTGYEVLPNNQTGTSGNGSAVLVMGVETVPSVLSSLKDRASNFTSWNGQSWSQSSGNATSANSSMPSQSSNGTSTNSTTASSSGNTTSLNIPSHAYIMEAKFRYDGSSWPSCGINIRYNSNESVISTVTFNASNEEVWIDRSKSNPDIQNFDLRPEWAPHTLFKCNGTWEDLDIVLVVDNSVVEVIMNGRTAITTRIHSPQDASMVSLFSDGAEIVSANVWHGIKANVTTVSL